MTNYLRTVTTSNGTYSVGMTAEQAKQQNSECYKNWAGQDFTDIDQDKNGVLSLEEILKANVKQQKRCGGARAIGGAVNIGLAVFGTAAAVAMEVPTFGASTAIGVACIGTGAVGTHELYEGVHQADDAEKMLDDYYKDKKAQTEDLKYKNKNFEV